MAEISVVIIDKDTDTVNSIVRYLKDLEDHVSVEGVASSFEQGYELIFKIKPMVVIMEVCSEGLDRSLEQVKLILGRFPQISIFATCADRSSDTILRVMRAGAAEYLLKPVAEPDLTSALQKLGRIWLGKPSPEAEMGRIITLFSPKGGVGVTTLAINMAAHIYEATNKPTILVDLDLYAGDVTTFLNMRPSYTISDVTSNMARLDRNFLRGVIAKHESGIHVLAEPQKVEDGACIAGDDIRKVLGLLRTMFSYVIIDTESSFHPETTTAFDLSDMLLLVFVLSLPGIKNVQRCLNYLERIGLKSKIRLVVNRYLKKGDVKIEEAEEILNQQVYWNIPNDYETGMMSLNKGVPLAVCSPRSQLNLAIKELATMAARSK